LALLGLEGKGGGEKKDNTISRDRLSLEERKEKEKKKKKGRRKITLPPRLFRLQKKRGGKSKGSRWSETLSWAGGGKKKG